MNRLKTWWLPFALLGVAGCGDDPPAQPPPPQDSGADVGDDVATDKPAPTDTPTPEDNPQPTDTPTPEDNPTPTDNPTACETGQVRCGDTCVDTQTNNANCGSCGNTCMGTQTCRAGMCQDEMMCPAGQPRCGTACVDTTADAMNCGSCGNACPTGQSCQGGMCRASECPTGQTRCGTACVDTQSDAANCGTCGNACSAGQTCMTGACRSTMMCPAGQTACGGVCVDTATDASNCGGCGTACPSGQVCTAGMCRMMDCPTGQTRCGSACVNTQTDAMNCGMCGSTCAAGQTCAMGMCTGTSMCPTGQMLCGTGSTAACADLQTDPANCGACGRACTAGQTCTAGACMMGRPMCAAGQTDCTPMAATPTCVNLQSDAMNCGACGTACAMGTTCQMGACRCPTGSTLCGRACVNTQTDAANCGRCGNACPTGRVCTAGACACPTGSTLCSGACVNTQTDEANCGACGTACPSGQTCTAGRCACPTGQMLCGTGAAARCVNTATDRTNCGMCGRACAMGQSCTAGACACPTGQMLCGTGTAAACADLQTSATNCGMCGRVCPAGQACTRGACMGTPPANDARAGATVITLGAGNAQNLAADTTAARHDTNGTCACTTGGNDVFYRFTLTAPTVIYADTLGATWDTSLFLQDSAGNNLTPAGAGQVTCNDDANSAGLCPLAGSLQSQIVARLNPGTYYLVLSGCGAGAATIHFQHLPAGSGPTARIAPSGTAQTVTGAVSGTGSVTSTCCSGGPENSYWWVTCPGAASTSFYASTCSATTGANVATYDVEIAQYSALRAGAALQVCNDDTGFTCGAGATATSTLPATAASQAGLNTMLVDSCSGSGSYTVTYVLANCAAGLNRCGAACVDPNTDETNCGGCNRRCAAGQTCVRGTCEAVRAGETRDNPIAAPSGATTATVNTSLFRNDTTGVCGCTAGRDVFYSLTLTRQEIVYADTIGSSYDTSLFFQDAMGVNIASSGLTNGTTCNDDGGLVGCGTGLQSQVMALLNPGTYYLVVSGCGTGGNASLRVHRIPTGNGALRPLTAGSSVVSGTTTGTGRVTSTCCSGGPEDTFYWYTCPAFAGGTFAASTCGRATWDTELAQVSAGRATATACNDDACGPRQSSLTTTVPRGPGLHALYVDGCGTASGAYTASVSRP